MHPGQPRPGLARADRAPRSRFVAIARGLGVDDAATDAFVYAYTSLPADERRRLADIVAKDLERAGQDTGRALAALFLCEEDPAVLEHLWRALRGERAARATLAFEAGGEETGGLLLGLPEREALGALLIGWRAEHTTVDVALVGSSADAMARLGDLVGGAQVRPAEPARVIDLAAERLWHHRVRGGELPAGIGRFAPLFSA